jgi:inorganic pyrophosphatase
MSYSTQFLGKTVTVTMDRQHGTKHPKHGFEYELNYGYIEGVPAPDGGDLDAYVMGVDEPLVTFTGKCIAVIHRTDDDDGSSRSVL